MVMLIWTSKLLYCLHNIKFDSSCNRKLMFRFWNIRCILWLQVGKDSKQPTRMLIPHGVVEEAVIPKIGDQ